MLLIIKAMEPSFRGPPPRSPSFLIPAKGSGSFRVCPPSDGELTPYPSPLSDLL